MAKNNEAKIKFTAETGEFNNQIKASESTMRELRSELKLNASEMKKSGENTETLKKRHEILTKELEASRNKTDALSKKVEKAKEIYGENSEEVKKLQIQLNNAKSAENAIQGEIDQTNKKLKEQKNALKDVADKAGTVGDKLTSAGKGMSVVSAGIVAAGGASIAAFNEVDEGADNAIKATGATGEAAEALEEAYGNVSSSIVGDFGAIGSALGEVNTRFGYTGGELETATEKFLQFSEITGMDSTEAVKSVARALNDAGIPLEEYDTLLDQLAKAGQSAGIDVGTLASSLSENGAIMRSMGFDTGETIALLSQFELSGANSTVMLSGMKKAMATWADEGKNGNKEFAKTVEGIKNGSIDASEAIDVFGTKAGPMLVDAIKSGKFEYQDMLSTIENSKGTVETTFDGTVDGGYEMELAMQNAKLAAAEVGDTLATSLTPILEGATEKLKGFANWWSGLDSKTQNTILTIVGVVAAIGPVLIIMGTVASSISKIATLMDMMKKSTILSTIATKAQTAAQWLLNTSIMGCPIMWIIAAIVALIAIVVLLVKNWDKVKEAGTKCWNAIKDGCSKAWNGVKQAWSNVKQWFADKWNGIKNVFANVKQWFSDKFQSAKQGVQNAWANIGNWFGEKISAIKSKFAKVKEAITAPFKNAIDKVKGFFNNLKLKFPNIKLPHFSIKGKFSLSPPSVPKLKIDWYAKGGIFTRPTIFNTSSGLKGVGEAGAEAVLPIDRLQGYIQGAIQNSTPSIDLRPLVNAIEELAGRPIDLNINGRKFAEATAGDTDSVQGYRSMLAGRGLSL